VNIRVAQVEANRVRVAGDDRGQLLLDESEGFIPGGLDMATISFDQRGSESVGVVVQLGQSRSLGAYEALAEDIVTITPDPDDISVAVAYLETARRLTERTGADVERECGANPDESIEVASSAGRVAEPA